jgi:hypothetical protein
MNAQTPEYRPGYPFVDLYLYQAFLGCQYYIGSDKNPGSLGEKDKYQRGAKYVKLPETSE